MICVDVSQKTTSLCIESKNVCEVCVSECEVMHLCNMCDVIVISEYAVLYLRSPPSDNDVL